MHVNRSQALLLRVLCRMASDGTQWPWKQRCARIARGCPPHAYGRRPRRQTRSLMWLGGWVAWGPVVKPPGVVAVAAGMTHTMGPAGQGPNRSGTGRTYEVYRVLSWYIPVKSACRAPQTTACGTGDAMAAVPGAAGVAILARVRPPGSKRG
jgi:hypothetical protein